MRIATITFQQDAISQMQNLQADIAKTQNDLATSKKLHSAADDPAGMVQVNQLNTEFSASKQYVTNGNSASANLKLEAQALSDATNVLQSARDLAVEANNAALTPAQRRDIATQLQQQLQDLVSIANQRDSTGNYLFAGTASSTLPFSQSGNSIAYSGATSVSQLQIAANQRISGGDTGATAFMNIPAGNGTFTTAAAAANTGTGSIDTGTVTNPSAWVPDIYTIAFTSPTQYQVTNSGGTTVTSGTFAPGDTISFNGIQVGITGTPATGDQFTVAKAGTASAFSTLSGLITTLNSPASPAQLATQIGGALQQIDGAISSLGNVSASVGARINSITSAQSSATTLQTNLQISISNLSDVDYAAAVTQLNTEELSLKAAQQTYASIAQLSLFNYIK
ncbi:MAG: flagellar hook-associated protein 3 [Gammaproteobacteria bacterium]|jgi:flagellar hook-associated protein 3 FlgL|nr:flagellar hook-associated protein 3 [Gammaproteobacteria bacterium]